MRQLTLHNEKGDIYVFDTHTLIVSMEGLGVVRDNVYLTYGMKYKKLEGRAVVGRIGLDIVFLNGYQGYNAFINYINKSKKLKLYYKAVDEKYCYVEFTEITKGQLSFKSLRCSLRLDKLTHWLRRIDLDFPIEGSQTEKRFPHPYPFTYAAPSGGNLTVINNGHFPAETIITISGYFNIPELRVFVGDEINQTLRILTPNTTGNLIVSSISTDSKVTLNDEDIYQLQDFTCTNFITLPVGESRLIFNSGVRSGCELSITYFEEYEGN
ncbi:MAG: phage tail family protein [Erysipelotrichales bacterium]|nr:phage tail family protein [Erysipelotrichales bacterium]